MRHARIVVTGVVIVLAATLAGSHPAAQLPLRLAGGAGQTVTPAFEGWYPNADGTVSLSFGYLNRNTSSPVFVPIGTENRIEPGEPDRGQPTHFEPGRHWGVFAVKVPAGSPEVVWTLTVNGETFSIPGHQRRNWRIDALEGEAGSGNTPPRVRFEANGAEAIGPLGLDGGSRAATVGQPLDLSVWASDDGRSSGSVASGGRDAVPITLTWFTHQGPSRAAFSPATGRIPTTGGSAKTSVVFDTPGRYVLRVRANDASGVAGAGHAQCCWTNAFLTVTVTR
jgi:hypothetical protein